MGLRGNDGEDAGMKYKEKEMTGKSGKQGAKP
jgi:hypothetical protein